jgi:hypothetical protein
MTATTSPPPAFGAQTQKKTLAAGAAAAVRREIAKVYPPPPTTTGVFARAVPHDRIVPDDRDGRALRHMAAEIEKRTLLVDRMHTETGARIDAWQELPKESAVAVAEAREIAKLVDEELAAIEALKSSVLKALHAAKSDALAAARKKLETLRDDVDRWSRDAQADKQALLVHGKSILDPRPKGLAMEGQTTAGIVEIPLPMQAQRAMADAIEQRQNESDVNKLPLLIADEQRTQVDLERRLGQALEAAREAMVTTGVAELRGAYDAVRAWGHSLAFEARRFKPKPS